MRLDARDDTDRGAERRCDDAAALLSITSSTRFRFVPAASAIRTRRTISTKRRRPSSRSTTPSATTSSSRNSSRACFAMPRSREHEARRDRGEQQVLGSPRAARTVELDRWRRFENRRGIGGHARQPRRAGVQPNVVPMRQRRHVALPLSNIQTSDDHDGEQRTHQTPAARIRDVIERAHGAGARTRTPGETPEGHPCAAARRRRRPRGATPSTTTGAQWRCFKHSPVASARPVGTADTRATTGRIARAGSRGKEQAATSTIASPPEFLSGRRRSCSASREIRPGSGRPPPRGTPRALARAATVNGRRGCSGRAPPP